MFLGYDDSNAPTNGGGDIISNGDDIINGNGGDDTIEAGGGDDTIDGGDGDDIISGGDGNDRIIGGAGADTMNGDNGNDFFIVDNAGDAAGDMVFGGNGFDTLDLRSAGLVVFRDQTPDGDGDGGLDGFVDFIDPATSNVVATIQFFNIETILLDDIVSSFPFGWTVGCEHRRCWTAMNRANHTLQTFLTKPCLASVISTIICAL